MTDWPLALRDMQPITIEACERTLSALVGSPAIVDIGSLSGSPRDGYNGVVRITAQHPDKEVRFEVAIMQSMRGPGDPDAHLSFCGVTLHAPGASFAEKLAAWGALRDAFSQIGCQDGTLTWRPATIVDEAETLGDTAMVARLRADITAALIAEVPAYRHVCLQETRADIDAVLAAYLQPENIRTVTFENCRLSALPAGVVGRFPNVEHLSWCDAAVEGHLLRGVSLSKVDRLHLRGPALRRLSREDVVGFPMLTELFLPYNPLEDLDPDIIEVCPNLRRVSISYTPLASDAPKLDALRARWQGVRWE
jgi:hypothetical protein